MVKNTKKNQKQEELDYANNIAALISLYAQQANGFSRGSSQKSAKVEHSSRMSPANQIPPPPRARENDA